MNNVTPIRKPNLGSPLGAVIGAPSSIPLMVRDAMVLRVKSYPWFNNFHFATAKALQIQPENIPFCGIYFIDQQMTPDGDANIGDQRFRTVIRIGFSVIVQNNDLNEAEYHLDQAFIVLSQGLLTDHTLQNWDGVHGPWQIQAFTRGVRSHQFGAIGQNNALPIAELRFDLTCDLGVITYDPVITDDLRVIHVKTAFPIGGDTEAVQQVEMEYDIPQGYTYQIGRVFRGSGGVAVNATIQ